MRTQDEIIDLFIIGGGVNGCGVARDAAGRGFSVELAEMDDLASGTSSAATKLFHGGLRYLEYFEFRLVKEALVEREILLKAMPHISWPMRFVLPYHRDMRFEAQTPTSRLLSFVMPWMKGRRPAWLIRFGLFLYDHLGGRKILPGTMSIDLKTDISGAVLQSRFSKAYEYSDCWVQDSRLVALNARDAADNGARIRTRTRVISAKQDGGVWHIETKDRLSGATSVTRARVLINVAGTGVEEVFRSVLNLNSSHSIRFVRGSHIVTKKLYDHNKCYFFQVEDGRIVFAIPYERDYTLIGTTDVDHEDISITPTCSDKEARYLCDFVSKYFSKPVSTSDIVWSYSGVRPLFADGNNSAAAVTRDYAISLDTSLGAPVVSVFGGKITTYRKLAEAVLKEIKPFLHDQVGAWTAGVPLPGGNFPVNGVPALIENLSKEYPFLSEGFIQRLTLTYGSEVSLVLGGAKSHDDLGMQFSEFLFECEVRWLMEREFAYTADDIVWRRTKLGLKMKKSEIKALDQWMMGTLSQSEGEAATN